MRGYKKEKKLFEEREKTYLINWLKAAMRSCDLLACLSIYTSRPLGYTNLHLRSIHIRHRFSQTTLIL